MITVKVINKDPSWRTMVRVTENIDRGAANGVANAADALVSDIRSNWSATSPSADGEAPAIQTGNLDSSVKVDPQMRDTSGRFSSDAHVLFVRVDTSEGDDPQGRGNYAPALEDPNYLNRPFIQPAIDRMEGLFPEIMRRFVKP